MTIKDLEKVVHGLKFLVDKHSCQLAELHQVVDMIHARSGEGVTSASEAMSDLFNRITDLETTVSGLIRRRSPSGYNEALERIERRAREQRMFDRTEMAPNEIMNRIVDKANKCQTPNVQKSS